MNNVWDEININSLKDSLDDIARMHRALDSKSNKKISKKFSLAYLDAIFNVVLDDGIGDILNRFGISRKILEKWVLKKDFQHTKDLKKFLEVYDENRKAVKERNPGASKFLETSPEGNI